MLQKTILEIVIITLVLLAVYSQSYIVQTKYGQLQGRQTQAANGKNVVEFLGVPFAKPPLAELRFKPPEEQEPWNGILEATNFPNSCMQKTNSLTTSNVFLVDFAPFNPWETNISEDCLYLNMWIPDGGNAQMSLLPVLMFFYGENFDIGSISVEGYNGGVIATEENVIMITANYRVASFGFLSLDDKEVSGNAGLLDQQMAMRWVSENVAGFGGDPKRVTIYGQSAGSTSVNFHLLMPSSWDYFTRAILQSGFVNDIWSLNSKEENDQNGWKLAESVKCKKQTLNETLFCLQKIKALDILDNEATDGYNSTVYFPVVDGINLKENPHDLYRQGKVKPCNIMAGTLKDEAKPDLAYILAAGLNLTEPKFPYQAITTLLKYDERLENHPAVFKLVEYQYTGLEVNNDPHYVMETLTNIINDYFYVCSMKELLQPYGKLSRDKKVQIYTYLLTYRPSWLKAPKWFGVFHSTDLPFTFGHALNTVKNRFNNNTVLPQDVTFTKTLLRYYANFARTGDPNISPSGKTEQILWPEYTADTEKYLILAPDTTAVGTKYRSKTWKFLNEILPQLLEEIKRGDNCTMKV